MCCLIRQSSIQCARCSTNRAQSKCLHGILQYIYTNIYIIYIYILIHMYNYTRYIYIYIYIGAKPPPNKLRTKVTLEQALRIRPRLQAGNKQHMRAEQQVGRRHGGVWCGWTSAAGAPPLVSQQTNEPSDHTSQPTNYQRRSLFTSTSAATRKTATTLRANKPW